MPLPPNQQLFEHRIARILGRGAFGTVYLAHDTLLDRPVAIKELTITAQTDEVAFKHFLQEARAAGGLNHPHVVTVVSSQKVGGIDETKITTDRELHDSVCPIVCDGLYRVFLHPG